MRKSHPARLVFVLVPALAFTMSTDLIMLALHSSVRTNWLIIALVFVFACRVGWQLTEFNGRG